MPLELQTLNEIVEQGNAEIRRRLPSVDPTVFDSWAATFINTGAIYSYTNQLLIRDLEQNLFIQSASGEFLDRLGLLIGQDRNEPSPSSGPASLPGTIGTVVPVGTVYSASNGLSYAVSEAATVQDFLQSIVSIERIGSIAIATTASDHNLATGISVVVSGADQTEYNGTFSVAATSRTQFQYTVSGVPTTPATGTISYSGTFASATIQSEDTGIDTNLSGGASLTLQSTVTGLSNAGYVQFDGVTGGADTETDEDYRNRLLLAAKTIEGVFTTDQVKLAALTVSGNTRVFVANPELSTCASNAGLPGFTPTPGQVAVYILRDNDASIIPSQTILDETKAAILEFGALPAHTSESDVFVLAPTTQEVDFDFASISPDTSTMRTAISNTLSAFFEDTVDFEETVTEPSYLGAIQNTQDLQTGDSIKSFSLNSPLGDIVVSNGSIAVLGSVTF